MICLSAFPSKAVKGNAINVTEINHLTDIVTLGFISAAVDRSLQMKSDQEIEVKASNFSMRDSTQPQRTEMKKKSDE